MKALLFCLAFFAGCKAPKIDWFKQEEPLELRTPTDWLVDIDETTWTVKKVNEEACKHEINRESIVCALAVYYKGKEPYYWE